MRVWSGAILSVAAGLILVPVLSSALAAPSTPNLGLLTVQPQRVHVGGLVTISGRTTALVQHLPPFVLLQSARLHTVNFPPGPCAGTMRMPVADHAVVTTGTNPGGRDNVPAGVKWHVQFRVPKKMSSTTANGTATQVVTPPGLYYLAAFGAGMDGPCGLETQNGPFISVGKLTVLP